jgi:hypothetical protein
MIIVLAWSVDRQYQKISPHYNELNENGKGTMVCAYITLARDPYLIK